MAKDVYLFGVTRVPRWVHHTTCAMLVAVATAEAAALIHLLLSR
ncbi:hypothetical protein AB0F81_50540 [Actinoplanes sp. NPDC024001]